MDISHWDATIHYDVQFVQYCDQTRSCNAAFWKSPLVYSHALTFGNTKVPVWTHGVQCAQCCKQTQSCNATLRISPSVYFLALRLRNTKEPVWTHESIGYLKMDISHWDSAIRYGVQFAQYYDPIQTCNATLRRSPQSTLLLWNSGTRKYLCGLMSPWGTRNGQQLLGRGNSLWRSPCPILWSILILKRYFTDIAPLYSLALRLVNTKLPVWTHASIGTRKWTSAIGTQQFTM